VAGQVKANIVGQGCDGSGCGADQVLCDLIIAALRDGKRIDGRGLRCDGQAGQEKKKHADLAMVLLLIDDYFMCAWFE